jgi:hypothetical protein
MRPPRQTKMLPENQLLNIRQRFCIDQVVYGFRYYDMGIGFVSSEIEFSYSVVLAS